MQTAKGFEEKKVSRGMGAEEGLEMRKGGRNSLLTTAKTIVRMKATNGLRRKPKFNPKTGNQETTNMSSTAVRQKICNHSENQRETSCLPREETQRKQIQVFLKKPQTQSSKGSRAMPKKKTTTTRRDEALRKGEEVE